MVGIPATEYDSGLSETLSKHIVFRLFGSTPIPLRNNILGFGVVTSFGEGALEDEEEDPDEDEDTDMFSGSGNKKNETTFSPVFHHLVLDDGIR